MERRMRQAFLSLAKNRMLTKAAKRYGLRFGASRFVAGVTLHDAVHVVHRLNRSGLAVTIDPLGEFVTTEEEAKERAEECVNVIAMIENEKMDAQLSIKLTSLGLDIAHELVVDHLRMILSAAKKSGVFVTIDMEDSERCQATIDLFKMMKAEYDHVGTVIQAYLYRSERDIHDLSRYRPNLRLVKGAYKEPADVAYPDKKDVDDNFKKLIKLHLLNGNYTAIATHDEKIIQYTIQLVKTYQIPNDRFEFQMLYGVRVKRQHELANKGYTMRIYVPYGEDWYGYVMRRIAERPANLVFVLKGVFGK